MSGYPEDITAEGLCHIEGHIYEGDNFRTGQRSKPTSTCLRCHAPNHQLRAYIGLVTRKANAWGLSWIEAEDRMCSEDV